MKYQDLAKAMCKQIKSTASIIVKDYPLAIVDVRVLRIMQQVPRHMFAKNLTPQEAYLNTAHPIGYAQTISQPYLVALMLSLLDLKPEDVALEIGIGSGYNAAVLSKLVNKVYTLEVITELYNSAKNIFQNLAIENVVCLNQNGVNGYADAAPYDAIVVTAAARVIPTKLLEQLRPGGRLVIPLEDSVYEQNLYKVIKSQDGNISKQLIIPVRFVPMILDM